MKPVKVFNLFLLTGCIALLLAVMVPRWMNHEYGRVIAALLVLVITSVLIWSYTLIVSAKGGPLLTQDAADYAYYLGFSLTVFALVVIFMTDGVALLLEGNRAAKISLENILVQFGAGLMATFMGVVARIKLLDRLAELDVPTEDSLRQFRWEMSNLVSTLRDQNSLYTTAITGEIKKLSASFTEENGKYVTTLGSEIARLVATLNEQNAGYVRGIGSAVSDLKGEIDGLKTVTGSVGQSLKRAATAIAKAVDTSALEEKVQGLSDALNRSLQLLTSASESIRQHIDELTIKTKELAQTIDATMGSMEAFARNMGGIGNAASASTTAITNYNENLETSSATIASFSNGIVELTGNVARFTSAIATIAHSLETLSKGGDGANSALLTLTQTGETASIALEKLPEMLTDFKNVMHDALTATQQVNSSLNELSATAGSAASQVGAISPRTGDLVASLESLRRAASGAGAELSALIAEFDSAVNIATDNLRRRHQA